MSRRDGKKKKKIKIKNRSTASARFFIWVCRLCIALCYNLPDYIGSEMVRNVMTPAGWHTSSNRGKLSLSLYEIIMSLCGGYFRRNCQNYVWDEQLCRRGVQIRCGRLHVYVAFGFMNEKLKADQSHPQDYAPTPSGVRKTDNDIICQHHQQTEKQTNGQTDRQIDRRMLPSALSPCFAVDNKWLVRAEPHITVISRFLWIGSRSFMRVQHWTEEVFVLLCIVLNSRHWPCGI